jgi:hypothetical protein
MPITPLPLENFGSYSKSLEEIRDYAAEVSNQDRRGFQEEEHPCRAVQRCRSLCAIVETPIFFVLELPEPDRSADSILRDIADNGAENEDGGPQEPTVQTRAFTGVNAKQTDQSTAREPKLPHDVTRLA